MLFFVLTAFAKRHHRHQAKRAATGNNAAAFAERRETALAACGERARCMCFEGRHKTRAPAKIEFNCLEQSCSCQDGSQPKGEGITKYCELKMTTKMEEQLALLEAWDLAGHVITDDHIKDCDETPACRAAFDKALPRHKAKVEAEKAHYTPIADGWKSEVASLERWATKETLTTAEKEHLALRRYQLQHPDIEDVLADWDEEEDTREFYVYWLGQRRKNDLETLQRASYQEATDAVCECTNPSLSVHCPYTHIQEVINGPDLSEACTCPTPTLPASN